MEEEDELNESRGSRISSVFRLWNWTKVGMSFAESGWSYLTPCFIDKDFRRRRATNALNLLHKTERRRPQHTSGPFHTTRCTFVQQADSKSDIYLHFLFFQLTCKPVLHNDVCRVLGKAFLSKKPKSRGQVYLLRQVCSRQMIVCRLPWYTTSVGLDLRSRNYRP